MLGWNWASGAAGERSPGAGLAGAGKQSRARRDPSRVLRRVLSLATAAWCVAWLIGCGDLERMPRLDKIKIGNMIDDQAITRDLQARLAADPQLAGKIQVETIERVVYLKGKVESNGLKQRATQIALTTPRVTKVANNVEVQGSD